MLLGVGCYVVEVLGMGLKIATNSKAIEVDVIRGPETLCRVSGT